MPEAREDSEETATATGPGPTADKNRPRPTQKPIGGTGRPVPPLFCGWRGVAAAFDRAQGLTTAGKTGNCADAGTRSGAPGRRALSYHAGRLARAPGS